jgi:ABC-2 type transport system ATP-binding protein
VDELAEILGDMSFLNRPPITYSGGQQRRLQILRALLHDPDFLVLDEPTTALDVEGRHAFYKALQDLLTERHLTAIWTTHYLEEVEHNCPRTIILKNGEILQDGSTQELKAASVPNRIEIVLNADDAESLCNRPKLEQNLLKPSFRTPTVNLRNKLRHTVIPAVPATVLAPL